MANYRVFSVVNTKLLAMQSKLLKEEDYVRLMELPNMEAQIHYLNTQTHYQGLFRGLLRVDEAELVLTQKRYTDLLKLTYYLRGAYERFFEAILLRFEVEEIKLILRGIRNEENATLLKLQSILLDHYSDQHPIFRFDKDTTLPSYIANLKETPYYEVLRPYADDESPRTLFYMEMLLDRYYYQRILDAAKDLEKEDRALIREYLGSDIDLQNLEFIYRGKKFYRLIPEEFINLSIPEGLHIQSDKIQSLAHASIEDFIIDVERTKYAFLVRGKEDVDLEMFRALKRFQYGQYKKNLHTTKKNIALLLTFLHLTEFEIRDIVAILEGKRYQMEKSEINRFLIRQVDESNL